MYRVANPHVKGCVTWSVLLQKFTCRYMYVCATVNIYTTNTNSTPCQIESTLLNCSLFHFFFFSAISIEMLSVDTFLTF